jgi:hypothetical protein
MKAKLIKKDDGYNLAIEQPQGRLLEATCSPSQQLILDKSGASTKHKLSKQNCDEIFGIVDVEKLVDEYLEKHFSTGLDTNYIQNIVSDGIKYGFNKAMELNKDKLFIREDMIWARDSGYTNFMTEEMFFDKLDMHNQQPTEIDVEIELICPHPSDTYRCGIKYGCDGDGCNHPDQVPYLDSEGCLILKKI